MSESSEKQGKDDMLDDDDTSVSIVPKSPSTSTSTGSASKKQNTHFNINIKERHTSTFLATARETFDSLREGLMASSISKRHKRQLRSGRSVERVAGESASNPSSSHNQSSFTSRPAGEEELQSLLNLAEYEAHQDPYRGILATQQSLETGTRISTPWHACEWGKLLPEPIQDVKCLSDDSQVVVRHVGNCACPTLKAWTRKRLEELTSQQKGRKRKRNHSNNISSSDDPPNGDHPSFSMGTRPVSDHYVCPCDYNPLCLGTLGGVVNDLIEERCHELDQILAANIVHSESTEKKPTNDLKQFVTTTKRQDKKELSNSMKQTGLNGSESSDGNHTTNSDDDDDPIQCWSSPAKPKQLEELERVEKQTMVDAEDESADTFDFLGDAEKKSTVTKIKQSIQTPPLRSRTVETNESPASIFRASTLPLQEIECVQFSAKTNKEIQQCRSSVEVDVASVRSYVHRVLNIGHALEEGADDMTVDRYMESIKQWHRQLLFENPIAMEHHLSSDRMLLSMPPGIRNLGATCYLNTQLQCLAQNLTFLNGIFNWRMVDKTHLMNPVMTKLQWLLAQMFFGGDAKLTTLEFSNALGLEHGEQQDPNEFARLLFERMEDSFQQCHEGDLDNLLNRIFHGKTTYETICLTCGMTSERVEGFMDLNLPITKRPKEKKKPSGTIIEAFAAVSSKNVDTDVQYCLDQTTCFEMLEGENQYYCEICKDKRDAKRIPKLTELPPVLNVQLSRYVFDRKDFTKKKVRDKVLLPTTLKVNLNGVTEKKYLLCAIMRHKGTSAYSGHYLAEAMDWMTGKWFEFNDEVVKLLPDGPSCSFDPDILTSNGTDDTGKSIDTAKQKFVGSEDAYNMYYVDESHLADSAKKSIVWREGLCNGGAGSRKVLDDAAKERGEKFAELAKLCLADSQMTDRLNRRRMGIRKFMLPDAHALVRSDAEKQKKFWVSTQFLVRYFRCCPDPMIESLLVSSGPLLRNSAFVCEHGRLSPRNAQRGKLLPPSMYYALLSLMKGERELLQEKGVSQAANDIQVVDFDMTNTTLMCQTCSEVHCKEMGEKVSIIRTAMDLYDSFDPKATCADIYYEEGREPATDEDAVVYIVSKQTANRFRRKVAAILKTSSKVEDGDELPDLSAAMINSHVSTGLSAMNIDPIIIYSSFARGCLQTGTGIDGNDPLDPHFNSNITCPHGNCMLPPSSRQVRLVDGRVWAAIKKFFPHAIEHKIKRRSTTTREGDSGIFDGGCELCDAQRDSVERLRANLALWARETKRDTNLANLIERKRHDFSDQEIHEMPTSTSGCHLVHKADIKAWQDAVKRLQYANKIKGTKFEEVRDYVESFAFPSHHKVVLEFENEPVEKLIASIRSFICREHHSVVKAAVLGKSNAETEETRKLASYVSVLKNQEYHAYKDSLVTLLRILHPAPTSDNSGIMTAEDKVFIESVGEVLSSHHPLMRISNQGESPVNHSLLKLAHDGSTKQFSIFPSICDNETCSNECALLANGETGREEVVDRIESVSVDSLDSNTHSVLKSSRKKRGSGASDPIVVESDTEDIAQPGRFPLRVFELEKAATEDEALKSLQDASILQIEASPGTDEVRRSSRTRRPKYPYGVLLGEDRVKVAARHNIAAICLLILERCNISANFSKLYLVLTPQREEHPKFVEVSIFSADSLLAIAKDHGLDQDVGILEHALLLYKRDDKEDDQIVNLVEFSNIHEPPNDQPKRKKKNRPSERGFSGTLLSGARPQAASTHDDKRGMGDKAVVVDRVPEEHDDQESMKATAGDSVNASIQAISSEDGGNMDIDSAEEAAIEKDAVPIHFEAPSDEKDSEKSWSKKEHISMDSIENKSPCTDHDRNKLSFKVLGLLKAIFGSESYEKLWLAADLAVSECADPTDVDALLASAVAKFESTYI